MTAHISCCHDLTLALCGHTLPPGDPNLEPDCPVCLDLHPRFDICPLGGACHLNEQPERTRQ